jgi:hypothetical protein
MATATQLLDELTPRGEFGPGDCSDLHRRSGSGPPRHPRGFRVRQSEGGMFSRGGGSNVSAESSPILRPQRMHFRLLYAAFLRSSSR